MDTKERAMVTFAKTFRHWRNGKVYRAEDYGHKAWPIRTRNGKRK